MGQYSKQLKNKLDGIINEMAEYPSLFARNPDKDFTRSRKIDFQNLIRILLSCGGNSLNKELYDYYRYIGDEPSDAEEMITHYILPIRPNRADRRKVVPKQAVFFTYRVA